MQGWPECYDSENPENGCPYDPWGDQLDYDQLAQVRDTVYAWYPECRYNTMHGRTLMAQVMGTGTLETELRLMKYADGDDAVGELLDSRVDTWQIP